MKALTRIACVITLTIAAPAARAIDIIPTFMDNAGQVWDATKMAVINQAISDWDARILNNQTIAVTFDFQNAGTGSYLGLWQGQYNGVPVGTDVFPWTPGVQHVVNFNADMMDSSQPNYLNFTLGSVPFNTWDALSVTRHELGHMLGFSTLYPNDVGGPNQLDKWTSHIVGTTFDPGGLNVQMAAANNLSHTADSGSTANDLMNPALVNGQRRTITAIDQAMLEKAYQYHMAPDPNGDGSVAFADLLTLAQHYGQTNANFTEGDFDGDSAVTFSDLLILAQHYGQTLAAAPADTSFAAVPEPATLGAFALTLGILVRRRR